MNIRFPPPFPFPFVFLPFRSGCFPPPFRTHFHGTFLGYESPLLFQTHFVLLVAFPRSVDYFQPQLNEVLLFSPPFPPQFPIFLFSPAGAVLPFPNKLETPFPFFGQRRVFFSYFGCRFLPLKGPSPFFASGQDNGLLSLPFTFLRESSIPFSPLPFPTRVPSPLFSPCH